MKYIHIHSYYTLVICLIIAVSCKTKKVVHDTQYINSEQMLSIYTTFSNILHTHKDSLSNYALYKSIGQWNQVKDSIELKETTYNILFIQYLYYFNYNMEIPNNYEDLYSWQKTYLYKDPSFLEQGDLVFYQEKHKSAKQTGFYLKNNYFVSAIPSGNLEYYHLSDTLTTIKLLSNAKLLTNATPE